LQEADYLPAQIPVCFKHETNIDLARRPLLHLRAAASTDMVQLVEDPLHVGKMAVVGFFQRPKNLLGIAGVGAGGGKRRYALFLSGDVDLVLFGTALRGFKIIK